MKDRLMGLSGPPPDKGNSSQNYEGDGCHRADEDQRYSCSPTARDFLSVACSCELVAGYDIRCLGVAADNHSRGLTAFIYVLRIAILSIQVGYKLVSLSRNCQ